MPEPMIFLLQGFMVIALATLSLSALAWVMRTVLAWVLRCFGISATADLPPRTKEEVTRRQKLFEQRRRMFDWGPTSNCPTEQWLYNRNRFGKRDRNLKR